MANGKCPGLDGTPIEFYKANWGTVGPLILTSLTQCIEAEHFPAFLTKGAIILLKKKNDQRLLGNKRPITLLHSVYKIGAKAVQRRLSPLLQRIITPQQSAFLPGRNIHHNILLLSEMLQRAHESGGEFILLKLDVYKAFDRLEWPCILATIAKMGMNGLLSAFLKAGFSTASSVILLNGRPTEAFRLSRSVRQGCPLSPLIFILALDTLSLMIGKAVRRRSLVGVSFPSLDVENVHSFYADNVDLLIKAELRYINLCHQMLIDFGAVSGLLFIWEKTIAAFIPGGPPPLRFWLFPWLWEEDSNATPSLGFPIASHISIPRLKDQIQTAFSAHLEKMRLRHLTLAGRVVVANSLILSSIWYFITLWPGDMKFFTLLQSQVKNLVWAGRSRVARNSSTQSKAHGGLGLLLIVEQYRAIVGNFMIWVLGTDPHPLRVILSSHIQELSRRHWGYPDFTWICCVGGKQESAGSEVWKNICRAWVTLKPLLSLQVPRNEREWRLPLWSPHINHRDRKLVRCKTQAQHRIRELGMTTMDDVLSPVGDFLPWAAWHQGSGDRLGERAYLALISNLLIIPIIEAPPGPLSIFFEEDGPLLPLHVWQFEVPPEDLSSSWQRIGRYFPPVRTFKILEGVLTGVPAFLPLPDTLAHRVHVRLPSGQRKGNSRFGPWSPDLLFLDQYCWRDEVPLLNTSTAQLRELQAASRFVRHGALTKWETLFGKEVPAAIWDVTWLSYRSACENAFLWQVLYRVIATQRWRFPMRLETDESTWCTRCMGQVREDTLHCIWGCGISRLCWTWSEALLSIVSPLDNGVIILYPAQILIADPLPVVWRIPEKLWHLLRAIVCWQLWKDRNEHFFEHKRSDPQAVIHKSWLRLGSYIRIEWRSLSTRIRLGKISYEEAVDAMRSQFGSNPSIWNLHEHILQIPPVPPRPP